MTCQWCKHYRRREGFAVCVLHSKEEKQSLGFEPNAICNDFSARESCTTCAYRCAPEEKSTLLSNSSICSKWKLRSLSTWGGKRVFNRKKKNKDVKEGEKQ